MKRGSIHGHSQRGGKVSKRDNMDGRGPLTKSEMTSLRSSKRTRDGTTPFQESIQISFKSVSRANLSEEAGVKPLSPEKKNKHVKQSICLSESHGEFTPEMFRSQYDIHVTHGVYFPQIQSLPDSFFTFKNKNEDENMKDDLFSRLPDEMILRVLHWVPRTSLGIVATVNRRLNRLSQDETLWKRMDASGRTLSKDHLNIILSRKPIYARFAQAAMMQIRPELNQTCNQLTHLDLSLAQVDPEILTQLFSNAPNISHLSLEHLTVSDSTVVAMQTFAHSLQILNVAMVYDIPARPFVEFLFKTANLKELNMSNIKQNWNNDNFLEVMNSLPATLVELNISGFRNQLKDSHVKTLTQKCKRLIHLDVSDCQELTEKSILFIAAELPDIQHLALSRCYNVEPVGYFHLHSAKKLRYLQLFTLFKESSLKSLNASFPAIQINTCMFSTVARPTTGLKRSSIWNKRVRN